MATEDGFDLVLSDHDEILEQVASQTAWYRKALSSRVFKFGISGLVAAAIAFAIVSVGNPFGLFGDATAPLTTGSAPQDDPPPGAQSSAAPQSLAPLAGEAPADRDIAAQSQTADQSQTVPGQAPPEAMLGRFQAWAARQDAPAEAQAVPPPIQETRTEPVQPDPAASAFPVQANQAQAAPVQATPVQAAPVQDARAEIRPVPQPRPAPRANAAQAAIRAKQNPQGNPQGNPQANPQVIPQPKPRREQGAGLQSQPSQNPDRDLYLQNPRTPSFFESLGFHN